LQSAGLQEFFTQALGDVQEERAITVASDKIAMSVFMFSTLKDFFKKTTSK